MAKRMAGIIKSIILVIAAIGCNNEYTFDDMVRIARGQFGCEKI